MCNSHEDFTIQHQLKKVLQEYSSVVMQGFAYIWYFKVAIKYLKYFFSSVSITHYVSYRSTKMIIGYFQ